MAISVTAATRIPPINVGIAYGSSTRTNDCNEDIPKPRATSRNAKGTCDSPVTTLRTKIVCAYSVSAVAAVGKPNPISGIKSA